ncbi:MAG: preprotein translocase subunit SecE [Planctomycetota bacterium]
MASNTDITNVTSPLAPKPTRNGEIVDAISAAPVTGLHGGHDHGGGLYKPGQGYWVRVLTASAMALLTLAAAAWALSQADLIRVPTPTSDVFLSEPVQGLSQGQTVTLQQVIGDRQTDFGTAVIESAPSPSSAKPKVTIGSFVAIGDHSLSGANRLIGPGTPPAYTATLTRIEPIKLFDIVWLKVTFAALVMVVGLGMTFWYVGRKTASVDFLVATDSEMKKVNWSSRRSVIDSTVVVVGACFLISGFLYVIDILLQTVFRLVGVLQH